MKNQSFDKTKYCYYLEPRSEVEIQGQMKADSVKSTACAKKSYLLSLEDFPGGSVVKNMPAVWETQVQSLGWEDSWRRKWQHTPVFLLGKFHGQRSLAGCSPWGSKESDTTEHARVH